MRPFECCRTVRPAGRRSGQALVEFVLIVPILLLLVFGLIDFARAWSAHHALADAAREGTRMVVVANPDVGTTEATTRIHDNLRAAGLDVSRLDIEFTRNGTAWNGAEHNPGDEMAVRLEYPYDFWILGPFMGWTTGDRSITLVSTITMRGE